MKADVVAAVAAVIAALASLSALGTSVYGVRHATAEARRLEQVRWYREKLADEVSSGVLAARGVLSALQARDWDFDTETSVPGLLSIRNIEIMASGDLHAAAAKLTASTFGATSTIKAVRMLSCQRT